MAEKVLVVDDVSMFVELQKDYLQLSAVKVLSARDGKEAFDICQAERPALVFMDLHMPVMNGADCCKAIKRDQQLRLTPVVLIVSEGKEADRLLCLKAGCDEVVTKPLDRKIFLETARKLLPAIDRRDRRISCRFKVTFRAFGVTLSAFIVNISKHGLYLATDHQVDKETELDLIFALPEPFGSIVQTKGRVAWLNNNKSRLKPSLPVGFGVEFTSLSAEAVADLARFVESNKELS